MKKTLIAIGALGATLALLMTTLAMGIGGTGTEDGPVNTEPSQEIDTDNLENWMDFEEDEEELADILEDKADDQEDPMVDFDMVDQANETDGAGPRFQGLVKRSYRFLNMDFIRNFSNWEKLPAVKTIFTANSSGEWMYNALPRINGTGEARIIDRNGDGYPELVIWKHLSENRNLSQEQMNHSIQMIRQHVNASDLSSLWISVRSGFTLKYVDRDGDGNPELITLNMFRAYHIHLDRDGIPEAVHSFVWNGAAHDRDDDKYWNMQRFNSTLRGMVDINSDRNPEFKYHERVNFKRVDNEGRQMWDRITASANRGIYIDRDSDGNASLIKRHHINGRWLDRDGDGWPNMIGIKIGTYRYLDKDSDGNPEITIGKGIKAMFMDRNDDSNPEKVSIRSRKRTVIDRDSNGSWDMIKHEYRFFEYLDRNSDGRPEKVERGSGEKIIYPKDEEEEAPKKERRKEKSEEEKDNEREKKERKQKVDDREKEDNGDNENEEGSPSRPKDRKAPSDRDTGKSEV